MIACLRRRVPSVAVVALALFAAITPARADLDVGEVTEMLAEDSGSVLALFGFRNGPDDAASLTFTSVVGVNGFSYSLDPGQTYLGQALTLSATGAYDEMASTWTMNASGTYGATLFTTQATQTRTLGPGYYQIISDYDYYENGVKKQDLHINLKLFPPIPSDPYWRSNDTAYFTDAFGVPIPGAQYLSFDKYLPGSGDWDIDIYPVFPDRSRDVYVRVRGNSPETGGAGTFTASIRAVPEPASLALLGLGLLGGAIARRRRVS